MKPYNVGNNDRGGKFYVQKRTLSKPRRQTVATAKSWVEAADVIDKLNQTEEDAVFYVSRRPAKTRSDSNE